MRFVDLPEARTAKGLRLVVIKDLPSPWSEAARGIFHMKKIDALLVAFHPRDQALREWTERPNAPVAMFDDEPPRSHWSEILALGERLDEKVKLLPDSLDDRARVLGLAHLLMGEDGLAWCGRLLIVHDGLVTHGARGFPERLARYLAPRYGYAPDRIPRARERVLMLLRHFGDVLESNRRKGSPWLVGDRVSAVDVYLAAVLGVLHPLPDDVRPMAPALRRAFETFDPALREAIPPSVLEHRELVYRDYLSWDV